MKFHTQHAVARCARMEPRTGWNEEKDIRKKREEPVWRAIPGEREGDSGEEQQRKKRELRRGHCVRFLSASSVRMRTYRPGIRLHDRARSPGHAVPNTKAHRQKPHPLYGCGRAAGQAQSADTMPEAERPRYVAQKQTCRGDSPEMVPGREDEQLRRKVQIYKILRKAGCKDGDQDVTLHTKLR